jgi:hypothetical protein
MVARLVQSSTAMKSSAAPDKSAPHNTSLGASPDVSGFRNLLIAAKFALMRAAASTQTLRANRSVTLEAVIR